MGFLNNGQTQTAPFGFDIYDENSARGAMKPSGWRSGTIDTGRTRSSYARPSGGGSTQTGPLSEETIASTGRFDVNLFSPLARTQPPVDADFSTGPVPDERLIPELFKSIPTHIPFVNEMSDENLQHAGNFFGLFGNVLDAGASLLRTAGGAIPNPFYSEEGFFSQLDAYGIEGDPRVQDLRRKVDADPAFAARYINEWVEKNMYWLADEGVGKLRANIMPWEDGGVNRSPSDPIDVRRQLQQIDDAEGLFSNLLGAYFMDVPAKISRVYTESGFRNIDQYVEMTEDQLADEDEAIQEIIRRYRAGEIPKEHLPTEFAYQGYSWSGDVKVNFLMDVLTDPANIAMGSGIAKSLVTNAGRRALAAATVNRFAKEFGKDAVTDLNQKAAARAAAELSGTGKGFSEKTLRSRATNIENKLSVIEETNPEFAKKVLDEMPATTRAIVKLTPTLDRAAIIARTLSDPLEIFFSRGGQVSRVAAFSSSAATEGLTFSYDPTNVNRLRELFDTVLGEGGKKSRLPSILSDGDTTFSTLLGRAAANIEAVTHRDSMVNSAIAGGQMPTASSITPTQAVTAASEARSSRLAIQTESTADRVQTSFVSGTKRGVEGNQEALEAGRRGARERLIKLLGQDNIDAIDDFLQMGKPAKREQEKMLALIEHLYYSDLIERFAKARTASEQLFAAKELAEKAKQASAKKAGGRVAKKANKAAQRARDSLALASRYALIGPRELTHQRAEKLLSVVNSTAMSDTAKAAAIRKAVDDYDILWSSFGARGISDHDMVIDMKLFLEDATTNNTLVKQISDEGKLPRPMRDLLNEEKAFARKAGHENYAIGERPMDDTLWRPTYAPDDGRLVGLNPWTDVITESAADYNIGRFGQARARLVRPIRGQKMVEEAKRQFRIIATDAGMSRKESEQLFSVIRGEASRRGVMPRGLKQEEIWTIAQGIDIDPALRQRLGDRGLARMVAKAFEGNWSTVGVANKIAGKIKSAEVPGSIPLLSGQPGPIVRYIAETVYPNVRFRYNPFFNLQEMGEPFFWNILRGIKPGITWTEKDLESLEALRRAGLTSEFEDQYEYSTNILLGAEAVREAFGPSTSIGRLWGDTIKSGRKVRSLAELKRLNYVRQTAQLNGNYLKQAMDAMDGTLWDDMVGEVGTHQWGPKLFGIQRIDNTRVANHYWLNKGLYSPDDPGVQKHLMDMHQPNNVGKLARISVARLATDHNFADAQGFRQAIRDGNYTEAQFMDRANEFGYEPEYARRAWRTASGQTPEEFYHSLRMTLRQGGQVTTTEAAEAASASRKIIQSIARAKGMSEEEFINDAFDGPVQYLNAARHLPKGARLQATRGEFLDPETPLAFGTPLRAADDESVQRVVEPFRIEQQAMREIEGPLPPDPTGGVSPSHPDVREVVPPNRKAVGESHTVGQKTISDWKENAALELGDDATLRAADEAVYVPALMLRIMESLPESTVTRLFPDLASGGRLTRNEEGAQRLLRAWAQMTVTEDMDLGGSVQALLALADSAAMRTTAEEAFDDRELWNLLQYGTGGIDEVRVTRGAGLSDDVDEYIGDALDDSWRVQNTLRAAIDGDVVPASNHQMRAFGYVDDIGIDDLDHGMKIRRSQRTPEGAAERYGVTPGVRREVMDEFDEDVLTAREEFLENPREVVDDFSEKYAEQGQSLTEGQREYLRASMGLDSVEGIDDVTLLTRMFDEAETASEALGLWSSRSGIRNRGVREGTVVDPEATRAALRADSALRPASVMGKQQYDYMTRKYTAWADELNQEEYLGRTDWTAASVAAVDNARYTQFTRGGAAWDIAAETRQHQAVLHFDTLPDGSTPMATIRPKASEMVEGEEGGLGLVEHSMGLWWAEGLEDVSGVKVQRVFTAREPKDVRRTYTVDDSYDDEMLELAGITREEALDGVTGEVVENVDSAPHRTTMVVTGTPEQIQRAVQATGAVMQKDRVSAMSLDLEMRATDVGARSVGLRSASGVGKSADPSWTPTLSVDYRVPAGASGDVFDRTFDALSDMLDDDWGPYDFGRMVFQDDNGDTVIRITHDGFDDAGQFYQTKQTERLVAMENDGVTFDIGSSNMYEESVDYAELDATVRRQNRVEGVEGDQRATRDWSLRGAQDPWVQRLDEASPDAAAKVRDRYRGEAVQQADFAYRQETPKSYEAKRVVDGDMPAPLRGWKWSHGAKGPRGAISWQADQRAQMYLLKNARADTVVHEMFHVFVKYIDPSLKEHMLKEYANANGLKRVPKSWSNRSEDWMAEQMVRYMKTGVAPDPNTQTGFNSFAKLMKGFIDDGDLVNTEVEGLLDQMFGRKVGLADATFMADQHRVWNAARSAMAAAEDEAFTTHYFKRGRSFLERSINHPYLGVYPASYMWGKALPELIRFLVAKPFGVDAPMWGYAQAVNVWEAINMQMNSDPEMRTYIEENFKEISRTLQMIVPGTPVDMPANISSPVRTGMRAVMDNINKRDSGEEGTSLPAIAGETLGALERSGGMSLNPMRWIDMGLGITEEIGEFIGGPEEPAQPEVGGLPLDLP